MDSSGVTMPVVTVNAIDAASIGAWLAAFGSLNVTITSEAEYSYRHVYQSGIYQALSVVVVTWSSINAILAIYMLKTFGFRKSIASVCLSLELLANISTL